MIDEKKVTQLVKDVLSEMDLSTIKKPNTRKQIGVFDTMEEALEAVNKAYTEFRKYNKQQRENIINEIRKLTHAEAETMAKLAVEDTGMGNVYHKILKHHNQKFLRKSIYPSLYSGLRVLPRYVPFPAWLESIL